MRGAAAERWRDSALCAQVDPELWFPEIGGSPVDAKRVCRGCPVRVECVAAVMRREGDAAKQERHGIVGGFTGRQRHSLFRDDRAGWRTASAARAAAWAVCDADDTAGGPQGVSDDAGVPAVHRGGSVAPEGAPAARAGHASPSRLPADAPESPSPTGPGARLTAPQPESGERDPGDARGAHTGAQGCEPSAHPNPTQEPQT